MEQRMHYARLHGHDYRGVGYYFVTFATEPRRALFSHIERGRVFLFPEGEAVRDAWLAIKDDEPSLSLRLYVVMPDHFHGVLVSPGLIDRSLPLLISRMKGRSRAAIRTLRGDSAFPVWEEGFHDYCAFTATMFDACCAYVKDNPARWQLRHDNPLWFQKHTAVSHPRLPTDTVWTAYGDQTLLSHPRLLPIRVSRSLRGAALEAEVERLSAEIAKGAVAIGGVISEGEHLLAKRIADDPRARLVYMCPWGLPSYKPHGATAVRRIAEGKTLVLSGFPDTVGPAASRANCLRNNAWAQAIAATPMP